MNAVEACGCRRRSFLGMSLAWAAAGLGWPAGALSGPSDYPQRSVRIVVPFPAGGATDMMARGLAQQLNDGWKQPVLVDNRAGANGMIGADAVAKAQGDGYTLLAATIAHAANTSLYPNAPYKFEGDLRPLAVLGLIPLVAVVRTDSPLASMNDLVDAARRGAVNAGSSGNGTAAHLALVLFNTVARAQARHVPYKGGAPAMTDLLGGQIDAIFALLPEALQHVRSGRLRALAITSEQRHPLLPATPTTAEAGLADLVITSWNALMAPAGVPHDLATRMNADIRRAIDTPQMRARMIEQGFQPAGWTLPESESFVAAEVLKWAKVIREANIKPD